LKGLRKIDFITIPLGWLLKFIYDFVGNYGITLIIFTALVKLILLPLSIKQQKSMIKMQKIQPLMASLQEKYKNDPQKQQQEVMKLYKENNVNPAGGCLPLLIQMPILICLYQVISYPLTYMFSMNDSQSWVQVVKAGLNTLNLHASELQIMAARDNGLVNFNLFGNFMDLSSKPSLAKIDWIWLIPILAGLTTYLSSKITATQPKKDKTEEDKKPQRVLNPEAKQNANTDPQSTMKGMTMVMPFVTAWIAFSYPASLGFYWTISNVLTIAQQLYLNNKYGDKYKEEIDELAKEKERAQKEKRRLKQKRKNK
jgi:YidC/Oxa1 family membrane protein insertase